jgi:hypothetical protein
MEKFGLRMDANQTVIFVDSLDGKQARHISGFFMDIVPLKGIQLKWTVTIILPPYFMACHP